MPVTPFHFGPGALLAAASPGRIPWTVFALSNVLIDVEPVGLYLLTGEPAHPWLHTIPGALAVAAVAALAGRRPCESFLRWWNTRLSPAQARWLRVRPEVGSASAWAGALLGTLTHVALDALMHGDVRILWPLREANPFVGLVDVGLLHAGCVIAGVAGIAILAIRSRRAGNGD